MAHTKEALYSNKIFLNAALPLVKVIANDVPSLKKKFENAHAVIQVSCLDPDVEGGKQGMHFVVNSGEWLVHTCLTEDPHIELEFKSVEALNDFFKGNISLGGIPKIKGIKHAGTLVSFVMVLLKMANLLGATEPPKDEETKELLVKCYFYLLSSGISQLNKMGHPEIHDWTLKSPDRVYAFASAPISSINPPICAPNSGPPSITRRPAFVASSISSILIRIPSALSRLLKRRVKKGIALLYSPRPARDLPALILMKAET